MILNGTILVDTNVVSELMNPQTHPAVKAWLNRMVAKELFLASTSLSELRLGIAILPPGRRKSYLTAALENILASLFQSRILAFDMEAAEHYAEMVSGARRRGQAISMADGQIAAIAAVHGYAVATRDAKPFAAAGVSVINPWEG
jgi:predicted nucleic acid-binding protein